MYKNISDRNYVRTKRDDNQGVISCDYLQHYNIQCNFKHPLVYDIKVMIYLIWAYLIRRFHNQIRLDDPGATSIQVIPDFIKAFFPDYSPPMKS
jgi:hypothetical protein